MKKLLKNLGKREIILIIICFILVCGQVWLELEMPEYMSEITVLVETPGSEIHDILHNGMSMVFCAIFSLILAILVGFLTSEISARFSMSIRRNLFKKVNELDIEDIENFSISSLITRTTNDITQIQMLVSMGLQLILKAPIMAVLVILKILFTNWQWSLVTLICMAIITCGISAIVIIVLPKFKKMQKSTDSLNEVVRENLNGIDVIKAFDAEKYQESKFEKVNYELTNLQLDNQKSLAIKTPILYLIMYIFVLGIYFLGAYLIKKAFVVEKLAIYGDMVVFASYAMQVISVFLMLSNIISLLPRAEVSANRINEVLEKTVQINDGNIDKDKAITCKNIKFKNVFFKYPDAKEETLKNISFDVNMGETLAIIGNAGSGKTSLINLILRYFDITSGEIIINDRNIKEYNKDFLYSKIGYIPQNPVIFNDTIKNNILYGINSKKKKDKIEKVIEIIDNNNNDEILSTKINKNEIELSKGQKQKISIARAIIKEPEIYILDDAFSGLDYGTNIDIIKRLRKYDQNAIILVVSENVENIKIADKVLILKNGKCAFFGENNELNYESYKYIINQGGECNE